MNRRRRPSKIKDGWNPLVLIVLNDEPVSPVRLEELPRDLGERCPFVLHDVRCALIVGHQRGHAFGERSRE